MDLRLFYQKLRKVEQDIAEIHVIVVSHETPDGGRAGRKSEVSRAIAALSIVEGRARLATAEETAEYRAQVEATLREAEQRAMADRVQVNVITESELRAMKTSPKAEKR